MGEISERKRSSEEVATANMPASKRVKVEEKRYDGGVLVGGKRYVMVVALGELACDVTCILIPQDELAIKARKLLHRVAGTFCFSERAMSKDKTGLLVTLCLICDADYEHAKTRVTKNCAVGTLEREMDTSRWYWCDMNGGRVLRESTNASVVDVVIVQAVKDLDDC